MRQAKHEDTLEYLLLNRLASKFRAESILGSYELKMRKDIVRKVWDGMEPVRGV